MNLMHEISDNIRPVPVLLWFLYSRVWRHRLRHIYCLVTLLNICLWISFLSYHMIWIYHISFDYGTLLKQNQIMHTCPLFVLMRPTRRQYNWKHSCGYFGIQMLSRTLSDVMYQMVYLLDLYDGYTYFRFYCNFRTHTLIIKCCWTYGRSVVILHPWYMYISFIFPSNYPPHPQPHPLQDKPCHFITA